MKRTWTILLAVCLLLTLLPVASLAAGSAISDVWVETQVLSIGQKIKAFYITVEDPAILEGLTADDFHLQGLARDWSGPQLFTFDVDFTGMAVDGNQLTLTAGNMGPKYFYVDSFTVTSTNARLTFTKEDLSKEVTPVVDEFEKFRTAEGAPIDYNLYTPENADGPLPLVLALHGSGDHLNLQQNRLALVYAEDMVQNKYPCYVMAPMFRYPDAGVAMDNETVLDKSVEVIKEMIAAGKVDPSRVYVTGKSMGGGNTFAIICEYPEVFAAALALCPAGKNEDLSMLADMPIYIVLNEKDPYESIRKFAATAYDKLVAMGNENAHIVWYTPQAMDATGFPNYHDVEVLVSSNYFYYDWLFAQVKE